MKFKIQEACNDCGYDMGEQIIEAENRRWAIQKYVASVRSDKKKERSWFKHPSSHRDKFICEEVV